MRTVRIIPDSMIYMKRTCMYVKQQSLKMPEGTITKGMQTRYINAEKERVDDYCGIRTMDMIQDIKFESTPIDKSIPCALHDPDKSPSTYIRHYTLNRSQFPNQKCPINQTAVRDENGTYRRHNLPDISVHNRYNEKLINGHVTTVRKTTVDIITTITQGEYVFTLKNGKPISAKKV